MLLSNAKFIYNDLIHLTSTNNEVNVRYPYLPKDCKMTFRLIDDYDIELSLGNA